MRMDSFELNKIIGAILGTLLFVMGAGFLAEAIYAPIEGRGPGYGLPEAEGAASAEAETEAPPADIGTLLASASADRGARAASKCQGCHNFEEGAGNKQGPELYGVVGRPIASHPGFTYSSDLAAKGAAGETWSYENLNAFLTAPKGFAPETKMNYGGLKNDAERADLIAYLASLSANPLPFPAPAPAAGDTAETAAGEEPASDGAESVPTEADAIPTPTESDGATEGTPTTSGTEAAPPATETPAETAPAGGTTAPAEGAAAPAEGDVVPEVSPN